MREKTGIKETISATVYGPDGKVKTRPQNWLQKLLCLPPKLMISRGKSK